MTEWYEVGGLTAGDLTAVYTAKGAASLAAALQNVLSPGTHDLTCTSGTASITADGIYIPLSGSYASGRLNTDITMDLAATTIFMCYKQFLLPRSIVLGAMEDTAKAMGIRGDYVYRGQMQCYYDSALLGDSVSGYHASGTLAIAANKFYIDGQLAFTDTPTTGTTSFAARFMGGRSAINYEGPGGTFQYGLVAPTPLTDEQILALHNSVFVALPAQTYYVAVL